MIEFKTAKYKGVEFLFKEMPTTGGNRLIKYTFPGSDKQAIERQGKLPKTFTITAIIPHDNYYQERDNLLRVLDDGIEGTLTHPTFGDIENVINGKYTFSEKISEAGRAEITIPFEVNDALGVPQESGALAAQVQVESDLLNDQLASDLADGYEVSSRFSGNFADALDNLQAVSDAFNSVAEYAEPFVSDIASFRQSINAFSGSIGALINAPADIASEIGGLFEDVNNLFDTPGRLLGGLKLLFDFGSDDPVVKEDTVGRVERKKNRDIIRSTMRVQALSYAYLAASSVESGTDSTSIGVGATETATNGVSNTYTTTEDLERTRDDLETQYRDARENQLLTNEALEQLDRVRVQAYKRLDVVRVGTRSIITIETPRRPLSVLVYEYYGSTELVDTISELNNIKQNAFVEGNLRILTA